ncbi:DNA-dependent RNA polymerase subunit epsilon [Salirhabdus sp. Marseille-P4669]|uniref:DNA-dependent RNA polymerase subunit epsilon n=1 Tax=Salirhabdus sp. Marseille-P4669 TaxID=2042310 RepID=UPI000C7D9C8B|nr:RNA polymerase epsilon subunit [Salirhabdus sp. Marseille-P4669]
MIYKVLYQSQSGEVPVRERTQALYVEGESVRDVRNKLATQKINIEHIVELDEEHLEYEKRQENFKVEKL